jgi:hypothetical protein
MIEMNLIYKSTYLLFCGTLDWRFGALVREDFDARLFSTLLFHTFGCLGL